ncbi:MAG TPA: PDZ domain-containing protein, partial [Anaeromyxobacteraceae bacterium]
GPSDHTSFYAKGVPVVFFFTGAHTDYHRPSDTADKIDADGLAAVARLAYRTATAAAGAPERYVVVRTPPPPGANRAPGERAAGYGAYLGSIPDFEERKEPGVLVSAVRGGSPADQAGMKGGDVIVRVGETRIANLQDLTYALRAHRAGDVVEVVWTRGGESLRAQVTLGERK